MFSKGIKLKLYLGCIYIFHVILIIAVVIRTRCNRETPKGAWTFGVLIVASI